MKQLSLFACLLLPGCAMRQEAKITTFGHVLDATGEHRLLLKFVERHVPGPNKAFDFHSLVWESKVGDNWSEKIVITRADFERGADRRRWISEIHSLDSTTGHAVMRIGEEQPREAGGSMRVEYSWREWDLVNNHQVRLLRVCKSPFETVDGKDPPPKNP